MKSGGFMVEKDRIAELVLQIQSGNKGAFDELYKLTSPKAFYVAFKITKNNQDAEDILQESYITALNKIGTLDKPESFVGWFHRIVANKSKDSLKKKRPSLFECDENEAFEVIPDEDTDFAPEASVDKTELQQVVMSVLDELNEEKRTCVLMYYFEECSVNDIAETLDVPVSTVKNRLFTARKDLQSKFSKRGITSAYSVAPIGLLLWAMRLSSDSVSKAFVKGPACAKVLAEVSATSAGTAATTAATGTGIAASGGLAAKITALTAVQKVAAGVAVAGIVGGSAFGVTAIIKNRNDNQKAETTKASSTEEVTTSVDNKENLTVMAQVSVTLSDGTTVTVTDENGTLIVTAAATEKNTSTTKGRTTTTKPTTERTTRPTTTKPTTTRRVTTTKPTTAKPTTTRAAATTTKPTTTRATTTAAPTTQASATLVITVLSSGGGTEKTITQSVPAGTAISYSYVEGIVSSSGVDYEYLNLYEMNFSFGDAAESGQQYNVEAEIS